MTVSQLETYRRLARKALLRATVHGKRPETLHWGVTMQDAGLLDWEKQRKQFEKVKNETADDPEEQKKTAGSVKGEIAKPASRPLFQRSDQRSNHPRELAVLQRKARVEAVRHAPRDSGCVQPCRNSAARQSAVHD